MKIINVYGIILDEKGIILGKDGILHSKMQDINNDLEECLLTKAREELNIELTVLGYLGRTEDTSSHNHFYSCKVINKEEKNSKILEYEKLLDQDIKYKDYIYQAIKGKYI